MRSPAALPLARRPSPLARPTWSLLPGKLSVVALFFFGKLCLDLGMMIGHQSRVRCVDVHEHHSARLFEDPLVDEMFHLTGRGRTGRNQRSLLRAAARATLEGPSPSLSGTGDARWDERRAPPAPNLIAGMAVVKRNDFAAVVDTGVPIDPADERKDDVLILYTSNGSLPKGHRGPLDAMSVTRAIENCRTMKVVLTEEKQDSNCIAVMGHAQESFHVHRFHRLPENGQGASRGDEGIAPPGGATSGRDDVPLRPVPRTVETRGVVRATGIPHREDVDAYLEELVEYLTRLKGTLDAVRPIAAAAAAGPGGGGSGGGGRTVVAMTVNEGQAELFVNFVCSCRSRGIDVSHVLLFATDASTAELASSMGVHVFEVGDAFGPMPTSAASNYGDKSFTRMILAKLYSVHLLLLLGWDVLLQDVDVVWLRDPLTYFANSTYAGSYDLTFQDDGSRLPRFAPYFANTGFYFVRANPRTVHLFDQLVRTGDVIGALKCDQKALSVLLSEHVSSTGLTVKVLGRDTNEGRAFPGGFHFHQRHDFMRTLLLPSNRSRSSRSGILGEDDGEDDGDGGGRERGPYIFHMSWTKSKSEKVRYLSQMGEWYVRPSCQFGSSGNNASSAPSWAASAVPAIAIEAAIAPVTPCCSKAPVVRCSYRDVPSLHDCRDCPPRTANRPPFWPGPDGHVGEEPAVQRSFKWT